MCELCLIFPQINFIFLFNIVRILMTKLRASTTSETIQYRYFTFSACRCSLNNSCRAPGRLIVDYLAEEEEGACREKSVCRVYLIARLFHRKAVKATLVLLPLLGITYMLFFVNPGEDEISQIVFIYFNSFLESFQVRSRVEWRAAALRVRVPVVCLWMQQHLCAPLRR